MSSPPGGVRVRHPTLSHDNYDNDDSDGRNLHVHVRPGPHDPCCAEMTSIYCCDFLSTRVHKHASACALVHVQACINIPDPVCQNVLGGLIILSTASLPLSPIREG